jgi:hypothetical protein
MLVKEYTCWMNEQAIQRWKSVKNLGQNHLKPILSTTLLVHKAKNRKDRVKLYKVGKNIILIVKIRNFTMPFEFFTHTVLFRPFYPRSSVGDCESYDRRNQKPSRPSKCPSHLLPF